LKKKNKERKKRKKKKKKNEKRKKYSVYEKAGKSQALSCPTDSVKNARGRNETMKHLSNMFKFFFLINGNE
jgi:hypothetical protein